MNGTSLDQATHDEAAGILKNATGEVKIVVSQFKSLGTSFLGEFLNVCRAMFNLSGESTPHRASAYHSSPT